MKAAVYGAGRKSALLADLINNNPEQDITAVAHYLVIRDPENEGVVLSLQTLYEEIGKGGIDALIIPPLDKKTAEVLEHHRRLGDVSDEIPVLYANPSALRGLTSIFPLKKIDFSKPWLDLFEYHVCDHCNLNCKGCGHCANLYRQESLTDLNVFERDIYRIRELFDGVGAVRLLGGEPLLNPDLHLFIYMTRKVFPEACIHLVTNGLLLTQMPEKLMDSIRSTGTTIDVTLYPPMFSEKRKLEAYLCENGLDYYVTETKSFYRRLLSEASGSEESFTHCPSSANHLVWEGKIACCAAPFALRKLKEVYGLQVDGEGGIQIHDEGIDGFEINRQLRQPMEICRHCNKDIESYPWSGSSWREAVLDDWLYHCESASGAK